MNPNRNKQASSTITVALGLICIVLAAGLIAVFATGNVFGSDDQQTITDLQEQIATQNSTINNLNAQINTLNTQLNSMNSSITGYLEQIANLTSQINNYISILHLNESVDILTNQTFTQDANTTTSLWADAITYAGYAKVQVQASSNTTYVQAVYTYGDIHYNQAVTVGTDGIAYFPILPSDVEFIMGNTDATATANNATVTITYCY
jgi:cell division protein FtsB